MARVRLLCKELKQLDGFDYGDTELDLSKDTYYALVGGDASKPDEPTPPMDLVTSNIANRLAMLLRTCTYNGDVYRRLAGGNAFWIFLAAGAWNPLHPVTPEEIQHLVTGVLEARRRHIDNWVGQPAHSIVTEAADNFGQLVDEVQSQGPHQQLTSLRGTPVASANDANEAPSVWPPEYLTGTDIALMAIKGVREKLFGLTNTSQAQGQSQDRGLPATVMPTRFDNPLALRAYLARVALTTPSLPSPQPGNGNGNNTAALYLAPVSFLDHQERTAWYKTTGHQSRLCATVAEFLEYALEVLSNKDKDKKNNKQHAACLLAPWFFESATAAAELARAHNQDVAIPTAWARSMPRAGMALVVTRLAWKKRMHSRSKRKYRVVLFTPDLPRYAEAAEPMEGGRREKQDKWVEGLQDAIDGALHDVEEGHIGGYTLRRYGGEGKGKEEMEMEMKMEKDSVALASQFIWELAGDPERAVPEGKGLVERGFAAIERWDKGGD